MTASAGTIPALLAATVADRGGEPAVVDGDVTLSWSELATHAGRFAAALAGAGVGKGDRVAIWLPNDHRWIVAVLGLWQTGAVLVPINTRFKGREAADLLARSRARALLTTTDFLGTDYTALLRESGVDLPDLRVTWTVEGWDDLLPAEPASPIDDLTQDDVADILFTSGTTGVAKGVVMTHGRTLHVATDWVAMTGLAAGDRYLMVNPYFHMFGLKAGILACVAAGATMYPEPVFDVDRALARVASERITVLPGAPTVYQSILDHPARGSYDLSSLRIAVTGAADIPETLIRRVRDELPFDVVLAGYGLTEAGTVSATAPDDDPATVVSTVGRARPGVDVRIVDDEIVVRGPSVMVGYLDDPESTAAALDGDGWLRTGDLGSLDERGHLRIAGRRKDMFIVGGFNVYPAEVENVLLQHPAVRQAAVIGVPDERLGEVGMAFVVTTSGDPAGAGDILAWSRDRMANYKVPRYVRVVDALPVNATGKVVKDELRALAAVEGP